MPVKKFSFLTLLLIFLSGTFGLGRLNLGISLEVRHVLMVGFWMLVITGVSLSKENKLSNVKGSVLNLFIVFAIYIFFASVSMFYTPDMSAALEKFVTTLFFGVLVLATIALTLMMNPKQFFLWISNFFVIVGLVYAAPVLMDIASGASRGDVGLSGPNVTTRIFFFATCSAFYLFSIKNKNIFFLLGLLFLSSIVMVGSRGGLVGAGVTLVVMFAVKKLLPPWRISKEIRFKPRTLLLIPFGIVAVYFLYEPVRRVIEDRIIGTTFQGSGVYTAGRDIIYADAIQMIKGNPVFGNGLEAFTVETGAVYPHNLFLEMALELGFVGVFVFIVFLATALRVLLKMRKSPLFIFAGLPLYMIVVQMFSGEFYDFRYYFLWLIPLLQFGAVEKDALVVSRKAKKKVRRRIVLRTQPKVAEWEGPQ